MSVTAWDIKRATLAEDLQEVEELTYADKGVTQLGALTSLVAVQQLSLAFNSLTSLRGIGALQRLHTLDVSHNSLSSLSALAGLSSLISLNAGHNAIANLAPITALDSLFELKLHQNAVACPSEVVHLSSLTRLQRLALCGNPVCTDTAARGLVWRAATAGLLTGLQVLDADAISDSERSSAHLHSWAAAAANEATFGLPSSATAGPLQRATATTSSQAPDQHKQSPLYKTSSGMGSRPIGLPDATFEGVADLLPDINVPTLKPRMLPNSGSKQYQEAGTPQLLPAAKRKPPTVVHTQHYANGNVAVIIRSNGTATLNWPGGELAASLDIDDTTDPAHPSYRLLAMFRGGGSVAASYDGSGGFVQHPSGGLMLLFNRKDGTGTAYSSGGLITARWHKKKPGMKLQNHVEAVLDGHLAVRMMAKRGNELQLFFACQGITQQLSLVQGAVLPDAADADGHPAFLATWPSQSSSEDQAAERHKADSKQRPAKHQQVSAAAPITQEAASTSEGSAPGGPEDEQQGMQDLLARARALMAASAAITSVDTVEE